MEKVEGYVACRGICMLFKSSVETKGFNTVRYLSPTPLSMSWEGCLARGPVIMQCP